MTGLTALVISYSANVQGHEENAHGFEAKEGKSGKNLPDLAEKLYTEMTNKDDIHSLFFERYGGNHKGFYVEKNFPDEERYLVFHADDRYPDGDENPRTAIIRVGRELESVESVIVREYDKKGNLVNEKSHDVNEKNVVTLYRRMLKASVKYIDDAEVFKGNLTNSAKYDKLVKDEKFVKALKNLGKNL